MIQTAFDGGVMSFSIDQEKTGKVFPQFLVVIVMIACFGINTAAWCLSNGQDEDTVLIQKAQECITANKYNEADAYLHKALRLCQKPGHYRDHAEVLRNIAQLRLQEKRYSEALAIGRHALGLAVKSRTLNRVQLIPYWDILASAYIAQNKYARAVPYLRREQRACRVAYGYSSPVTLAVKKRLNDLNSKIISPNAH